MAALAVWFNERTQPTPLLPLRATDLAATVSAPEEIIAEKNRDCGCRMMTSTAPAVPAFAPDVGGRLMVTDAPFVPWAKPTVLAIALAGVVPPPPLPPVSSVAALNAAASAAACILCDAFSHTP